MRIALFAPYLPAPALTGGRIRIHQLTRALADEHEITLFCAAPRRELEQANTQEALQHFSALHLQMNPLGYLPELMLPQKRLPRRVVRSSGWALRRAFQKEHHEKPFDVGVVEHSYAAKIALDAQLPFVLDEHNIESRYLKAQDSAGQMQTEAQQREEKRLEAWQNIAWQGAQEVVTVSKDDAEFMRPVTGRSAHVVANGVDLSAIRYMPPSQRIGKKILFVGLMSHTPNIEAAKMLAQQVMPLVWQNFADAQLVLCGHNPTDEVSALSSERVEVTGSVSSVSSYLEEAALIVNPLRHGAGTSLKVVEALACGAPLLTTRVGIRGYPESLIATSWITDSAEEMAQSITLALENSQQFDKRSLAGREEAKAFDWQLLGQQFTQIVEQIR